MRKRNVPIVADDQPMADLSNVTSLRATLIRSDNYSADDARNLNSISRLIISGLPLEIYLERRRRLYGPGDKPDRDEKGRVVWSRRELSKMSEGLANLVRHSPKTFVR